MATIIGNTGTTWFLKDTAKPEYNAGGPDRMTETYQGNKANFDTFRTSYSFGQAHPTYSELILHKITPTFKGTFGEAKLLWMNASQAASGGFGPGEVPPPGATYKRLSSGEIELPINTNPNWSGSWEDPSDPNFKDGIEAYMAAAPSLVYGYADDTFEFTESDIVENLFTRSTENKPPMGLTGDINFNRWLLWSREATPQDGVTVIESTWRYAPAGWDTDIYDAAT